MGAFTDGQNTESMRASAWGQMAERQRASGPRPPAYCTLGCPDDVCRALGECAWPAGGPPEYGPDDAEAQRIAEVPADARAELDRGL